MEGGFTLNYFLLSTFHRPVYPCLCLCLGFSQITRMTPFRFTILHLSQIFLTDALTFIFFIQLFRKLNSALQLRPSPCRERFQTVPYGGELSISPEK